MCLYAVDLRTFKAVLNKENIMVWNQVDGTKRKIHGTNERITMFVSVAGESKVYVLKGWYPFENVARVIEEQHDLTRGCYKLSYKYSDASDGDVLIKTDRDWHDALRFFSSDNYIMRLDLKKIPMVCFFFV